MAFLAETMESGTKTCCEMEAMIVLGRKPRKD